jgi:hypothetical protein
MTGPGSVDAVGSTGRSVGKKLVAPVGSAFGMALLAAVGDVIFGQGGALKDLVAQAAGVVFLAWGAVLAVLVALWLKSGYRKTPGRRRPVRRASQKKLNHACVFTVCLASGFIVSGAWMIVQPNVWVAGLLGVALFVAAAEADRSVRNLRPILRLRPIRVSIRDCGVYGWWAGRVETTKNFYDDVPDRVFDVGSPPDRQNRTVLIGLYVLAVIGAACLLTGGAVAVVGKFHEPQAPTNRPQPKVSAASPPPAATPRPPGAAVAGIAEPTYSEMCGTHMTPGEGAPEPQRSSLNALAVTAGTPAGCIQRASVVGNHPDVFIAQGFCEANPVSLLVASPTTAGLLYKQGAEVALGLARRGVLLSASSRIDVAEGDAYVYQSDEGPWVAIRETKSAGSVSPDPAAAPCARYTSRSVRYTVLPPPLVAAWIYQVRVRGQWLWPDVDETLRGSGSSFYFFTADADHIEVARAHCDAAADACTFSSHGGPKALWTGTTSFTAKDLELLAPP